jgi:hypothetical protein
MACAMSPLAKIAPACTLALLLSSWRPCAIWPSPSFIAAAPFKLPLPDGISLLILARLSPSFFNGGLPSNNSQTLAFLTNGFHTTLLERRNAGRAALTGELDAHIALEEEVVFMLIEQAVGEEFVAPFRSEQTEIRVLRDEMLAGAAIRRRTRRRSFPESTA